MAWARKKINKHLKFPLMKILLGSTIPKAGIMENQMETIIGIMDKKMEATIIYIYKVI